MAPYGNHKDGSECFPLHSLRTAIATISFEPQISIIWWLQQNRLQIKTTMNLEITLMIIICLGNHDCWSGLVTVGLLYYPRIKHGTERCLTTLVWTNGVAAYNHPCGCFSVIYEISASRSKHRKFPFQLGILCKLGQCEVVSKKERGGMDFTF